MPERWRHTARADTRRRRSCYELDRRTGLAPEENTHTFSYLQSGPSAPPRRSRPSPVSQPPTMAPPKDSLHPSRGVRVLVVFAAAVLAVFLVAEAVLFALTPRQVRTMSAGPLTTSPFRLNFSRLETPRLHFSISCSECKAGTHRRLCSTEHLGRIVAAWSSLRWRTLTHIALHLGRIVMAPRSTRVGPCVRESAHDMADDLGFNGLGDWILERGADGSEAEHEGEGDFLAPEHVEEMDPNGGDGGEGEEGGGEGVGAGGGAGGGGGGGGGGDGGDGGEGAGADTGDAEEGGAVGTVEEGAWADTVDAGEGGAAGTVAEEASGATDNIEASRNALEALLIAPDDQPEERESASVRGARAAAAAVGLADHARHVIFHVLDPRLWLADRARHVIIHILDPRFLIYPAAYDVASKIRQALRGGGGPAAQDEPAVRPPARHYRRRAAGALPAPRHQRCVTRAAIRTAGEA